MRQLFADLHLTVSARPSPRRQAQSWRDRRSETTHGRQMLLPLEEATGTSSLDEAMASLEEAMASLEEAAASLKKAAASPEEATPSLEEASALLEEATATI